MVVLVWCYRQQEGACFAMRVKGMMMENPHVLRWNTVFNIYIATLPMRKLTFNILRGQLCVNSALITATWDELRETCYIFDVGDTSVVGQQFSRDGDLYEVQTTQYVYNSRAGWKIWCVNTRRYASGNGDSRPSECYRSVNIMRLFQIQLPCSLSDF